MNDIVDRTGEPCLPNQIAVDLPYRDLVIEFLNGLETGAALPDESDETLDLGLITLTDASSIAAKIMDRWAGRIPIAPRPGGDPAKLSDIEKILDGIRIGIGESNDGRYPEMGKVREANIGGLPHIGSGWEYPEIHEVAAGTEFLPSVSSVEAEGGVIGMIDSPVYSHPQLTGRWDDLTGIAPTGVVAGGYPWLTGHGTFVAGRILHRAPGACLKVYGLLGGVVPVSTVWEVAKAMADAAGAGIKVLNLSVGCFTEDGQPPFILARAVKVLNEKGVAVIAAAGNHGEGTGRYLADAPIFPAACPGAIAVGAFEDATSCRPAVFNPKVTWIALGAPGVKVESTYIEGLVVFSQILGLPPHPEPTEFYAYAKWSGTSFATATVSGEIARIMAKDGIDAMAAVKVLQNTAPATNSGIGRY
jgi:hypothetical protein